MRRMMMMKMPTTTTRMVLLVVVHCDYYWSYCDWTGRGAVAAR
jgi:hypothetical protein